MLLLTTTELRQMQNKQDPLEKRIQMLETLIAANNLPSSAGLPTSLQQVCMAVHGLRSFAVCQTSYTCCATMQGTHDVCRVNGFQSEPDPMLRLMTDNPRMQTTLDSRRTYLTCDELKHMDLADLVKLYSVSASRITFFLTSQTSLHTVFSIDVAPQTLSAQAILPVL